MHLQKIRRRTTALQGILAILAAVAAVALDGFLTSRLRPLLGGPIAAALFWIVGVVLALVMMRRFVLSYAYLLAPGMVRVSFAYGRMERLMLDLYLNNVRYIGTLEEMKKRCPGARVTRATLPDAAYAPLAVAHRDDGKMAILLISPDDEIREALEKTVRARKK